MPRGPNKPSGLKPRHPQPLTAVQSFATIHALAEVMRTTDLTVKAFGDSLADLESAENWIVPDGFKAKYADFSANDGTIRSHIKSLTPPNAWLTYGIFLWLSHYHSNTLLRKQLEEQVKQKETVVKALTETFSPYASIDYPKAALLSGEYKLYRPFFLDPMKNLMVSKLVIGDEESPFNCKMTSAFNDAHGKARSDTFSGKVVPHGNRMMAILNAVTNPAAYMIFHFDDIDYSLDGAQVDYLSGLALTSVKKSESSAWPIYAARVDDEEFSPSVIDAKKEWPNLPEPIRRTMARGAVHWQERLFPSSFGPVDLPEIS